MAFARNGDVRLHWREDGAGPPLLLLNSVGCDLTMWDAVMPHLRDFRVLRMDMRGHAQSDSPPGDYALDQLAADTVCVLDAAGVDRAAVCGLSLGGMTAMTVVLNAPARVSSLILACTSAQVDREIWNTRIETVRSQGMAAIVDAVMARFFSEEFRRDRDSEVRVIRDHFLRLNPDGYASCCAAIRDMALLDSIIRITAPTLVVAGSKDVATPFETHGSEILKRIPGAQLNMMPAAHIAPVEMPDAFAAPSPHFFREFRMPDVKETLYQAGLAIRRKILGDAWVDKSLAARTDFTTDFQDLITRNVWNEIWNRPGLDHKTRRLLVVATTASLGAWEEFRLHVRTGLEQKGFSQDELKEVLLQIAVYAGAPAANTAFAEAGKVIESLKPQA